MAKKPAKKVEKKKAAPGGVNKMVVLGIMAIAVPFSLPTCIVLGAGMAPTLGSYVSEKGPTKYEFLCVGGVNFAGVIPYLFGLWFGVDTIDESIHVVTETAMLLWAWLAAGAGWIIYRATPPLVASYIAMTTQRRINGLRAAQRKLVDDWGHDVMKLAESAPKKK